MLNSRYISVFKQVFEMRKQVNNSFGVDRRYESGLSFLDESPNGPGLRKSW